jgi:hypothetical protein
MQGFFCPEKFLFICADAQSDLTQAGLIHWDWLADAIKITSGKTTARF